MKRLDKKLFSRGDTTLSRGLMGNVVTLVVVVAGGLGSLLLFGSYRALEDVSHRAIEQAVERTEADLNAFFSPIDEKAKLIQSWGEVGDLKLGPDEIEGLNRRLRPMVEGNDHLSAMSVADMEGREYLAWQDDGDTWMTRYSDGDSDDDMAIWVRWDGQGQELERWIEEREEDTRLRPWYVGAMSKEVGEVYWTDPFAFVTSGESGITASLRYDAPEDGGVQTVALGVSLEALSDYTKAMKPTENGFNAVMTTDGQLMGLPASERYINDDHAVHEDVLSTWEELSFDDLGEAWATWRDQGRPDEKIQGRSSNGRFWAGFRHFELGDRNLVVSTVVPRQDLMGTIDRQRNAAIGLSLLAILVAIFVSLRTSKKYRQRMEEVYDDAQELGQYRIGEQLGVGGMGEVYRAEHAMLKRPTAIKLLKPDLYDRNSIKRFEREVQLSCRLTHPNTVTIFDYGKTDDGLFYYAMELLEGVTLDHLLEYTGPLPDGRVLYLLTQVCGALVEAHEVGLIHRDIKPSNIMVGNEAGLADRVTVLDFGLVKDIETPEDTQLTNQDHLHGSPGFMAPEVIMGESAESPQVDIFAVGSVAYALLCGEHPFTGDSTVSILMAQVQETPPRPSEVLGRQVDPDLEALVMDCLQKNPADRPSTMAQVQERLFDCESVRDWVGREALVWWKENHEKIKKMWEEPEPVERPEAFDMTLSMVDGEVDVEATIDKPPEKLVDAGE